MATIYHGTDVSHYQGTINWTSYASAKDFVIIKAGGCDAGYYQDSKFTSNQTGARAQGLRIGYYYFGDRTGNAITAANNFISIVGALNHGEILALDIEGANYPQDSWAYDFVTTVHSYFGFYPFVYMSQHSPTNSGTVWVTTNPIAPLWMANYGLSSTDFSQTTGNADITWGGLPAPNYQILQYSSTGSVSGITGNVDLDTFYSPNNSLTDWDALGYAGGGPGVGTLNDLGTLTADMTYATPLQQTIAVPKNSYDQVLYSNVWNTSISASSWPQTITAPAANIGQYAYTIGNFSGTYNGNPLTTADFGSLNLSSGGYGQFPGYIPPVFVQPAVSSSGVVTFIVTYTPGGSATLKLTINYALIAYPDATTVKPTQVLQSTAYSNSIPFNSTGIYSAYRRIASDVTAGTGTSTIAHGQSTIPNILFWVLDNSGDLDIQPSTWSSGGYYSGNFGVSMDSTNVYTYVDSANNSEAYIRVYRDN